MHTFHIPVLLDASVSALNVVPERGRVYVDGTVGGGGHAAAIAARLGEGLLIGVDKDGAALLEAERKIAALAPDFRLLRADHTDICGLLRTELQIDAVDGFLLDLGVSSHQLDTPERGFSYRFDAALDMRMDDRQTLTAAEIVNTYKEKDLVYLFKSCGEERFSGRIARAIVAHRALEPLTTTFQLVELIKKNVPFLPPSAGHPAMRVFQALRIAVNGELTALARTLEDMVRLLKPRGRIAVISFHSLEDRIVKQTFRRLADPCECPRSLPYCVCGKEPLVLCHPKNGKGIRPTPLELTQNPRAHSATLRVAERL